MFDVGALLPSSTTATFAVPVTTLVPTSPVTLGYTCPSSSGSTAPNTSPWASPFTASWRVRFASGVVSFYINANYHAAQEGSPTSIQYTNLLSSGYRPDITLTLPYMAVVNGVNAIAMMQISTVGTIFFYANLAAASYPTTGIQGHQTFSTSWPVD